MGKQRKALSIRFSEKVAKWTEERRLQQSERMKSLWREFPDFAARQMQAMEEGNRQRWADPEFRARRLSDLAYQRCSPAYVAFPRIRLLRADQAEYHANLLRRLNTDPEIIARRKQRMREKWADPEFRARMTEVKRRNGDRKRGFRVPRSMWATYQKLRRSKGLTALEAGRALGLVK